MTGHYPYPELPSREVKAKYAAETFPDIAGWKPRMLLSSEDAGPLKTAWPKTHTAI